MGWLIDKVGVLISSASPPDLVLNRHYAECELQTRGRQNAIEKNAFSRAREYDRTGAHGFQRQGSFHCDPLSFTFRPRRRPKGLKDKREGHH
jgi:hypothetical protein